MNNTPVYTMMPERDHPDIILIAIIDMMLKYLKDRNATDKNRTYRLERIHTALLVHESRYEGSVPEHLGDRADRLDATISKALTQLVTPPRLVGRDVKTGRFV